MRYFGRERIEAMLRSHIQWAKDFAALVDAHPKFERIAPVPLSVICFRYKGSDDENKAIMEKVNASGRVFIASTVLNGKLTLRLAIGNLETAWKDVQEAWESAAESGGRDLTQRRRSYAEMVLREIERIAHARNAASSPAKTTKKLLWTRSSILLLRLHSLAGTPDLQRADKCRARPHKVSAAAESRIRSRKPPRREGQRYQAVSLRPYALRLRAMCRKTSNTRLGQSPSAVAK